MTCKVVLCLTIVVILIVPVVALPQALDAPTSTDMPSQATQDTRLMQQMDHQRRLNEQRRTGTTAEEILGATNTEESAAGLDVAVIIVLAASALAFFIVCRIRGGSTRHCATSRRSRPNHPSKN
jgi:hypothetical protein